MAYTSCPGKEVGPYKAVVVPVLVSGFACVSKQPCIYSSGLMPFATPEKQRPNAEGRIVYFLPRDAYA